MFVLLNAFFFFWMCRIEEEEEEEHWRNSRQNTIIKNVNTDCLLIPVVTH